MSQPLSPAPEPGAVVSVRGVRQRYPGVIALAGVDFDLRPGEIHALLGENGAGKSTLMGVIAGLVQPQEGALWLRGEAVPAPNPRASRAAGVGMVHQRLLQSERHSALQNIALGHPRLPWFPRWSVVREEVAAVARRAGFALDLDAPVGDLPLGTRQKIEILRALYHGAGVLLLDEPTAVLSAAESADLFAMLQRFRAEGGSAIFTSHKLDEVLALADRVTVLRRGAAVGTFQASDVDADTLARLMVGEPLRRGEPTAQIMHGAEVLALKRVGLVNPQGGPPLLDGISLTVRAGEVLGVAGVAGSGQVPLAELIAGLRAPSAGKLRLMGRTVTHFSPGGFARAGVAYIPEDRHSEGVAGALPVLENLLIRAYSRSFSEWGVLDWARARAWASDRLDEFNIQGAGLDAPAATLSGGNLQKVILARELDGAPLLIVAAYPTRGLDVAAAQAVRERLLTARWRGAAVVLISEDLDDLFRMADRIAVLFQGRLVAVARRGQIRREEVGQWMGGHAPTPPPLDEPSAEEEDPEGTRP